jgi:hypothetical protein
LAGEKDPAIGDRQPAGSPIGQVIGSSGTDEQSDSPPR